MQGRSRDYLATQIMSTFASTCDTFSVQVFPAHSVSLFSAGGPAQLYHFIISLFVCWIHLPFHYSLQARFSHKMLQCACCRFARYCSKSCQITDWATHKLDCRKIKRSSYSHRERRALGVYYGCMRDDIHINWQIQLRNMERACMAADVIRPPSVGDVRDEEPEDDAHPHVCRSRVSSSSI